MRELCKFTYISIELPSLKKIILELYFEFRCNMQEKNEEIELK
jgi:hypothetical protein